MEEHNYWTTVFHRRLSRRRVLVATGSAGGAALTAGVLGCGDDDSDGSGAADEMRGTAVAETDGVKTGGTYRAPIVMPTGIDVMKNPGGAAQVLGAFSLSRLLKYETGFDDPATEDLDFARERWYNPVPDLAASWEIPDGQTFIFTLQPDARWHDIDPTNGRAVTAEDIVFAYGYYQSARPDGGALLSRVVEGVDAVAPDKVQFRLNQAFAPFLGYMSRAQDLWIYPPELIEADGDGSKRIVGSGPWLFESLQRDVGVRYRRNPNYWVKDDQGRSLPYMEVFEGADVPDPNTQITQFQSGNILQVSVPAALLSQFRSQNSDAVIRGGFANLASFLFFPPGTYDENLPPFNDVRVRRAVSHAIDRDALIALGSNDAGGQWNNLINAGAQWYLDPAGPEMGPAAEFYEYNPDRAKELLADAGYESLDLDLYFNRNGYVSPFPFYNPIAEALPAMMEASNINLTLKGVDYLSEWINPESGIFWGKLPPNSIAWALNIIDGDPDGYLHGMLHPDGTHNNPGHSRVRIDEFTRLVEEQRRELDVDTRRELVFELQRRVSDQMIFVPMVAIRQFQAWQPFVKNRFGGGTSYGFPTEDLIYYWLDR
ncbi:MAG TPA: ABC transporter substrate-binding protein [Dehalococcoidia bacterium]|nr:ABC transporter substrate-binding protein [Dehalococcoidia bacterium]